MRRISHLHGSDIFAIPLKGGHILKNCTSEIQYYKCSKRRLLLKARPGLWTPQTLKKLDPEKSGSSKTWTLKNMDPGKHRINIGFKNMSDFRELCFIKTMRNVICCFKSSQISKLNFLG